MNRHCIIALIAFALLALPIGPQDAAAQSVAGPDVWRTFAERLEPGRTLNIRLKTGERFKAMLLQVSPDALTVQPKTRAAVPPQRVPFAAVETLEVDSGKGGANIVKAVAVGAAVGAGVFFGLLTLALAAWAD